MKRMTGQATMPDDDDMSDSMRRALEEVSSMGVRGLTAVPVKPTLEMLTAGADAGKVSIGTVMRIYAAMLQAAD